MIVVASFFCVAVALMAIQIFKLFPVGVPYTSLEGELAENVHFYRRWFSFLLEAPNKYDRDLRYAVSYKTLARKRHIVRRPRMKINQRTYDELKPELVKR